MIENASAVDNSHCPDFNERNHFVTIGNFLHEPNRDAVEYLKTDIWPLIRKRLPEAELHVYGAYHSNKEQAMHNEEEGFIVKGRAENAREVISNAKVMLAPLRVGAGLKGKLLEAMVCGTPSVTTAIGAEGMAGHLPWSGAVCEDKYDFAEYAVRLYTRKNEWKRAAECGKRILIERFDKQSHSVRLIKRIKGISDDLENHRDNNFTGIMLLHHAMASNKYMGKWIEAKNKLSESERT